MPRTGVSDTRRAYDEELDDLPPHCGWFHSGRGVGRGDRAFGLAFVRGVINLRGKIFPIIDLRLRFGFAEVKNTDVTCIVVVQVKLAAGKTAQTGLIVDQVEEVTTLAAADIQEPPDFGAKAGTEHILGMARAKGAVRTLIDIDRVLAADAAGPLQAAVR